MSLVFPVGYKPKDLMYKEEDNFLYIRVDSQQEAASLLKDQYPFLQNLAAALEVKQIRVCWGPKGIDKYYPVGRPGTAYNKLSCTKRKKENNRMVAFIKEYPYINGPLLGGCDYEVVQRLVDEISKLSVPAFLVSMDLHRNLIVNEAALIMMRSTPEELFRKNLSKLWVPPTQLKPITYENQLPPHLQEVHTLLKQTKELMNHSYYGWKNNGDDSESEWVKWTSDIKYRSLGKDRQGRERNCRLMVSCGYDVIKY